MNLIKFVILSIIVVMLVGCTTPIPPQVIVVQPQTVVETVEVVVTQEVIKYVEVTPTPELVVVSTEPVVTEPVQNPYEPECVDSAWVKMQPISNIAYDELRIGAIKRLHFQIENTGTCIWEGYVLSSNGVVDDIPVPTTYPGEVADVIYDFYVEGPIEARWFLQPPVSELYGIASPLLVSNSASPGIGLETIYYKLETKPKKQLIPYFMFDCKPGENRYK